MTTENKTLKIPSTLYRAATFERAEAESPLRLVISTDTPYKRFDWEEGEYWEVLDHSPQALDDERLRSPGLPILFNHDTAFNLANARKFENDGHKITLDESGFIWAAGDFAQNKKADVESGALPHCSVGYEITGKGIEMGKKDGLPIYKLPWKVFEASVVPVPADVTAATNRMRDMEKKSDPKEIEITPKNLLDVTLKNENNDSQDRETSQKREKHMDQLTPEQVEAKAAEAKAAGQKEERERGVKIQELSEHFATKGLGGRKIDTATLAAQCIKDGKTVDEFRNLVMEGTFSEVKAIETPDNDGKIIVVGDRPQKGQGRSIGAQFIESKEFKAAIGKRAQGERVASIDVDSAVLGIRGKVEMAQRAGFTSSDLAAVNVQIQTGVIGLGVQRLTIMDLIAPGSTGAAAIIYPRENSFGTVDGVAVAAASGSVPGMPRAKSVGERGLKPLWEPDLTTETANVKKIAVTTKVPDEFMADFPAARSFIDERLPFMVDTETEFQLLYGDGLGNNLKGIFTTAGVQTRAITTTDDSTKAASLMQGLTDIRVNSFFEPDGYAFHPYDWETAKLLKDDSKRFLAGGPYYIPYTNGVFMELNTFWGKPVVISTAVTYRQPLAGCWKLGAQYFLREGMRLEMTNANEDDFRRNLIMLRAEHRLALAVYRPVAFLEFTGFPARA